jgi:iron complex transport system permease protein
LGESTAQSLGVPLRLARLVLVGVISLATGAAVAHIGLVAFVGLAAPHVVRSLLRCTHAWSLLLAALMGGALVGVDVSIAAGRWTCVVGPNGAGKSTLLKVLAGLVPHEGQGVGVAPAVEAVARTLGAQEALQAISVA